MKEYTQQTTVLRISIFKCLASTCIDSLNDTHERQRIEQGLVQELTVRLCNCPFFPMMVVQFPFICF
jgi:hypothetical protein